MGEARWRSIDDHDTSYMFRLLREYVEERMLPYIAKVKTIMGLKHGGLICNNDSTERRRKTSNRNKQNKIKEDPRRSNKNDSMRNVDKTRRKPFVFMPGVKSEASEAFKMLIKSHPEISYVNEGYWVKEDSVNSHTMEGYYKNLRDGDKIVVDGTNYLQRLDAIVNIADKFDPCMGKVIIFLENPPNVLEESRGNTVKNKNLIDFPNSLRAKVKEFK